MVLEQREPNGGEWQRALHGQDSVKSNDDTDGDQREERAAPEAAMVYSSMAN